MSGQDIRAGAAFVEAYLEKSRLMRDMKSLEGSFREWGTRIASVGMGVMGAGLAVTAPFAAALSVFADVGGTLEDMSARTGISVGALGELGFAADQTGASMETVETSIKKMQKTIAEASDGNKDAASTLADLGVSLEELNGISANQNLTGVGPKVDKIQGMDKRKNAESSGGDNQTASSLAEIGVSLNEIKGLSPDQQFARIGAAIAKIQDPAQRTNAALSIFGKSGTQLLPMIQNFDQLAARARELGLTLSAEDTAAADAFGDSLDELWAIGKKTAFTIGAALAPSLQKIVGGLTDSAASAARWIDNNRGLVTMAAAGGVALVGLGGALTATGVSLRLMGPALGLVRTGVTGLVSVAGMIGPAFAAGFAALTSPLGLVLAGVTALAVGFFTLTDSGKQTLAGLGESFGVLLSDATSAFEGIKAAMAAGDFQAAAEILWAGLELAWTSGTSTLQGIWADVIEVMSVAWNSGVAYIGGVWDSLMLKIQQGQDTLAQAVAYVGESLGIFDEGTQQTLTEDQKARNEATNRQMAERAKAREKELEASNLAAFEANNKKKAELEEKLAKKREALNVQVDKAKELASVAANAIPNAKSIPTGEEVAAITKNITSKGTFSGAIAAQLSGSGDMTAKKLDEAKQIHQKQLEAMNKVVKKLENSGKLVFTS
mgnify:CR=1 FL=1